MQKLCINIPFYFEIHYTNLTNKLTQKNSLKKYYIRMATNSYVNSFIMK